MLIAAVALDALFGEPPNRLHPVAWFGSAAGAYEAAIRRRASSTVSLGLAGAAGAVFLPVAYALAGLLTANLLPAPWRPLVKVWLLKSTFSLRGLLLAGQRVRRKLDVGNLDNARSDLRVLVSRPVDELDEGRMVSAVVESLAENTTDSFLAPWLAYALGGLPAAMAYRALNTLDAMWGYREAEYEWFGKAAARMDDLVNYLPAWLSSRLLLAAGDLQGLPACEGRRALARFGGQTASPNAGRTMAVTAGLLGVQLEKPGAYRLGAGTGPLTPPLIARTERLVAGVAALGLGVTLIAMGLRSAVGGDA